MTIRKLFPAAFVLLIFALHSCTKENRQPMQTKTSGANTQPKPDAAHPASNPGQRAATGLTELTEIEPGVYWCYYGGISMKFRNLVYQVAAQTTPNVYADLFWIDPASNCNVEQGGNFSNVFVINKTYCSNGLQTSYTTSTTTRALTGGAMYKIYEYLNGTIVSDTYDMFDLGNGQWITISIVNTGIPVNGQLSYTDYTYKVTGSLCSSWVQNKVIGKLFTQMVNGVRKFYVAPANYPDPVSPPEE